MVSNLRRALISCVALMLAVSAVGGSVMMAQSDSAPEPVRELGQQLDPTGDARALGGVGVAIGVTVVAAGAKTMCDEEIYICKDDVPSAEKMAKVDALETKKSLYQQAVTQRQNNDNWNQQVSNELQDSKTVARTVGKQEYIRQLENGSAESVARAKAKEAVADYFTVRQQLMISQWETTLIRGDSMEFTAKNTTNLSQSFVEDADYTNAGGKDNSLNSFDYHGANVSVQLANGTSESVVAYEPEAKYVDGTGTVYTNTKNLTIDDGETIVPGRPTYASSGVKIHTMRVKAPTDNYDKAVYLDVSAWSDRWSTIEQYNSQIQSEVDNYINSTYDSYQQGDIDTSDLVDPYLGARNYDPGNSSSWSIRSAAAIGINPPSDTSNVDVMEINTTSQTLQGLLMTEGDYTIEAGLSYNASNMTGSQYVMDPATGEMTELTGQFTVESITTPDGSSRGSVQYTDTDYNTTNIAEFENRMQKLNNLTAQINARQQKLREQVQNGQTTGVFPNLPGSGAAQAAAVGLVVMILLIMAVAAARP